MKCKREACTKQVPPPEGFTVRTYCSRKCMQLNRSKEQRW